MCQTWANSYVILVLALQQGSEIWVPMAFMPPASCQGHHTCLFSISCSNLSLSVPTRSGPIPVSHYPCLFALRNGDTVAFDSRALIEFYFWLLLLSNCEWVWSLDSWKCDDLATICQFLQTFPDHLDSWGPGFLCTYQPEKLLTLDTESGVQGSISFSITCELITNADLWTCIRTTESETIFIRSWSDSYALLHLAEFQFRSQDHYQLGSFS